MTLPTGMDARPEAFAVAAGVAVGVESPAAVDYLRGVHPVDAMIERARQTYRDRRANRDPYPSQEWVTSLNTGRGLNAETWRERQASDARLQAQTEVLAAALERTGIRARGDSNVTAIGLVTGEQEALNGYRSICFLPMVAQRDRRPMLNDLRYFQQRHPQHRKYMRYAVITNGPTVPVGGLPPARAEGEPRSGGYYEARDRIRDLSRGISRLAEWARAQGVELLYRGIEFTVARRNGDDFLSLHPHANVLYTPLRKFSKAEWQTFLRGVHEQLGGWWWKDCGVLKDPNEAIKYAFKPAELEGLDDAALRWLYEQTFGLKMAQPMGAFKDWRNATLWTEEKRDGQLRRRQHRKVVTLEYAHGRELSLCSVRRRPGKPAKSTVVEPEGREPPENVLMGVTMPQRRFSPYAEPCVLVMNYTPSPGSEWGRETLDAIERERRQVLPVWHMNGAPDPRTAVAVGRGQAAAREGEAGSVRPFIVHTRSSTAESYAGSRSREGPPVATSSTADPAPLQLSIDTRAG